MSESTNYVMCGYGAGFRPVNIKDLLRLLKAVLETTIQKLYEALKNFRA